MQRAFLFALFALGCGALGQPSDSATELAPWSDLPRPDLGKLASGKPVVQCNASMSFARGLSGQTMAVVRVPVDTALRAMLECDPATHPELETYQYHMFRTESEASFERLSFTGKNSAMRHLLAGMSKGDDLQLTAAERSQLPRSNSPEEAQQFFAAVLRSRWSAAATEGDLGNVNGQSIRSEIASLLKEEPKIAQHFAELLKPLLSTEAAAWPATFRWGVSKVNGTATVELGANSSRAVGGRRQALEVTFYASSGYFTSLTLSELVPITLEGRPCTFASQVCFVSSPQLAGGFGIKRQVASMMMKSDLERSVRLFQQDAAKLAGE